MIALVSVTVMISVLMLGVNIVYGQDSTYSTTWDECVDMYDIFICAELEEFTEEKFGRTFNHTEVIPEQLEEEEKED